MVDKPSHTGRVLREYDLGVGAAVVRDGHILLVQEAAGPYAGTWSFPKGLVEIGETADDAALRELREEAGLEGRVVGVVGLRTRCRPDSTSVFIIFRVEAEGEPQPDYLEVSEARFFSTAELMALDPVFPLTRVLALRALEGGVPLREIDLAPTSGADYKVFA
jgi:ADP-ribose pyrophosphatase YjhB (NUDIX family)